MRHLVLPRGGQPEVEVLAQQRRGEGGVKSRLTKAGVLYRVNVEPITLLLMQARNACLLTPLFSARTVTSARDWVTTPRNRLWHSFTVLASLAVHRRSVAPAPRMSR